MKAVDSKSRPCVQKAKIKSKASTSSAAVSLIEKMTEKLKGARFRFINEALYTKTGHEALELFTKDPDTFQVYHEGYEMQREHWPDDPLDFLIKQLKQMLV